jgi:voltage-gated potassium channel Kch
MSTVYIPALAAFGGSAFGAVSTIISGWFSRRRRLRERHHARSFAKRERLYRHFIEEASRLYADALVNDRAEIPQLVSLYTLVGRMRILSNSEVVQAAERTGRLIIETYLSPNRDFVDLPKFIEEVDPLRDFGEACRSELMNVPAR